MQPKHMLYYEKKFRKQGFEVIVGVDEAGRGPLAGPVVAAAACLQTFRFENRIDDSKKLNLRQRESAFLELVQKSDFGLGIIDEGTIDDSNILVATRMAMEKAVNSLLAKLNSNLVSPRKRNTRKRNICVLVDGNVRLNINYPIFNIIKGDAKSKSIAAASILAKVTRDHIMSLYDRVWPQYGFSRHKGYPTSLHRGRLERFGPCPIHRFSFSYV